MDGVPKLYLALDIRARYAVFRPRVQRGVNIVMYVILHTEFWYFHHEGVCYAYTSFNHLGPGDA